MDAVSLPPSFLPHRSPQQVCSPPPPLSHCQKPKPQLQKEFFSPLLPDCHMEKPFPGFMRAPAVGAVEWLRNGGIEWAICSQICLH